MDKIELRVAMKERTKLYKTCRNSWDKLWNVVEQDQSEDRVYIG